MQHVAYQSRAARNQQPLYTCVTPTTAHKSQGQWRSATTPGLSPAGLEQQRVSQQSLDLQLVLNHIQPSFVLQILMPDSAIRGLIVEFDFFPDGWETKTDDCCGNAEVTFKWKGGGKFLKSGQFNECCAPCWLITGHAMRTSCSFPQASFSIRWIR